MTPLAMESAVRQELTLIQETLDGNQLSFQLLVERYQDRMFALARTYTKSSVEVEDIVQDTFLKAFHKLHTYKVESSFSTWLHRIAVNTALDFLKRAGRNPVQAVEDPEAVLRDDRSIAPPDSALEREEIARITQECLAELPEIFRTVLVLREFQGLSYQELADCLGISIGTVESRLFRARARFKEALIRLHPEYAEA